MSSVQVFRAAQCQHRHHSSRLQTLLKLSRSSLTNSLGQIYHNFVNEDSSRNALLHGKTNLEQSIISNPVEASSSFPSFNSSSSPSYASSSSSPISAAFASLQMGPSTPVVTHVDCQIDPSVTTMSTAELIESWHAADNIGNSSSAARADPWSIASADLEHIGENIRQMVALAEHPVLDAAAKYFFSRQGKRMRPMIVLLTSRATTASSDGTLQQSQRRLAEITEMIHTASLLHDDVIDGSDTRRGSPSLNAVFGNKIAILAGDLLLARASINLARLRNVEVIELLSTVIEHLAVGEVLQMAPVENPNDRFRDYMSKTFYKTASLIANSSKAATILGGVASNSVEATAAYLYGKHVGLAFQLVDDLLDYTGTASLLGKPAAADLKLGLSTAPILFALQNPKFTASLSPMVQRKFSAPGDVEKALEMVHSSDGLKLTEQLAATHCLRAVQALQYLPPSAARSALVGLAGTVLTRQK